MYKVGQNKWLLRVIKEAQPEWFSDGNKRFFGDVTYRAYYGQKSGNPYLAICTYAFTDMLGGKSQLHWRIKTINPDTHKIGKLLDDVFPDIYAVKHWLREN